MNTGPQNRCGSLWARTRRQDNETRALDARKASCVAPISMGRGEIPVEPQPTAIRFLPLILCSTVLLKGDAQIFRGVVFEHERYSLLFSSLSSFTLKSEAELQKHIALCKQVEASPKNE